MKSARSMISSMQQPGEQGSRGVRAGGEKGFQLRAAQRSGQVRKAGTEGRGQGKGHGWFRSELEMSLAAKSGRGVAQGSGQVSGPREGAY